jgi:hypothetical protein
MKRRVGNDLFGGWLCRSSSAGIDTQAFSSIN